jgi:transcriptional repressor NrdR
VRVCLGLTSKVLVGRAESGCFGVGSVRWWLLDIMRCPFCREDSDKVVDSRSAASSYAIRRRRECLACKRRFTTYERVEQMPLRVVKKDGSRVPFDRDKIMSGMMKACEKRPVPTQLIEEAVTEIEAEIYQMFDKEVPSKLIGDLVMKRLAAIDQVAYVRFASVYREFKDVSEFLDEVRPILDRKPKHRK